MTALAGQHLGMDLHVDAVDSDNAAYFGWCACREFRLQACAACDTLRYPPAPCCPACGGMGAEWRPVPATGTIYTYTVVHQATQAHMKPHAPYAVVVVELDAQPGRPIRVAANLVDERGLPLQAQAPRPWGIGSRVRMAFARAGPGLGIPLWQLE